MGNVTKPKKTPNKNNANHLNHMMALVRNQQKEVNNKARQAQKFLNEFTMYPPQNNQELRVFKKLPGYMRNLNNERRELEQIYTQLVRRQIESQYF